MPRIPAVPPKLLWPALFSLGLAYQLWGIARSTVAATDFRCLWLAGRMLLDDIDPYGDAYRVLGARLFPNELIIPAWFYPPHISPLVVAIGAMPLHAGYYVAMLAWLAIIFVGVWAAQSAARASGIALSRTACCALLLYALTSSETGFAIKNTQPSIIAFAGAAIALRGFATGKPLPSILGVVLLSIKPQLALPLIIALLFVRHGLITLAAAGGVALLLGAPAFIVGGVRDVVSGFVDNTLHGYGTTELNGPDFMLGLPHLFNRMFGIDVSNIAALFVVVVATALLCGLAVMRRGAADGPGRLRQLPLIAVGATIGVGALHVYDLVILNLALPFTCAMRRTPRTLAWAGAALLWRPENVTKLTHAVADMYSVATIGGLLLFAGVIAQVIAAGSLTPPARSPLPEPDACRTPRR